MKIKKMSKKITFGGLVLFLFLSVFSQKSYAFINSSFNEQGSNIALDPLDKTRLYFAQDHYLYTSENNGTTWSGSRIMGQGHPLTNLVVKASPSNTDLVYVIGIDNQEEIVIGRSNDKGKNIVKLPAKGLILGLDRKLGLLLDPKDPRRLYLWIHELSDFEKTNSQLFISNDWGLSWQEVIFSEIAHTQRLILGVNNYREGEEEEKEKKEEKTQIFSLSVFGEKGSYNESEGGENGKEKKEKKENWEKEGERNFLTDQFLNPLYAVGSSFINGVLKIFWYRAEGIEDKFELIFSTKPIPSGFKVIWFAVEPDNTENIWAIGWDQEREFTRLFYSADGASTWDPFLTSFLPLKVQVHPANSKKILITSWSGENYFSQDRGENFTKINMSFPNKKELFFSPRNEDILYAIDLIDKRIFRSYTLGNDWLEITPHFDAEWISQLRGEGIMGSVVLTPGEKKEVWVKFRNRGNVCWHNRGDLKVGLYVYKDEIYSSPPEYSNPDSPYFGESFFADVLTWGGSANGKIPNSRAAYLNEEKVCGGEMGTFRFNFKAPLTAAPNSENDDINTLYDDRFYREDLTLAYGSYWMDNTANGDPLGKAHIWFPIQVIENKEETIDSNS